VISSFALQAAIFGAPAAELPAGNASSEQLARASSSDSDEQPQVVELHEIAGFSNDVSTHNISKSFYCSSAWQH